MPDLVEKYCGANMYKLLVTTAMGDYAYFDALMKDRRQGKYIVRQEVFSHTTGTLQQLSILPELQPYVIDIHYLRKPGDPVNSVRMAGDIVAWVDLEFETREQQLKMLRQIKEEIYPVVSAN
jgi:hypothetical protein